MPITPETEQVLDSVIEVFSIALDNFFALLNCCSEDKLALNEANQSLNAANQRITELTENLSDIDEETSNIINNKFGDVVNRAIELNAKMLEATPAPVPSV